ncbi:MAG: flagellar hook-length control protein FliK [Gemmataceae bacterium]|nr:flagellar hook-length control protein FliK [Gemmata sp.]MDW8199025.1 flagellar hook-length control protein FliK [Gemmataceae bacterium]
MQIPWAEGVNLATVPTGGGIVARVVAGSVQQLPIGELLEATVTAVSPRGTILTVNGTALTVRPPYALTPGAVVGVRVPPQAAPAAVAILEFLPAASASGKLAVTTATPGAAHASIAATASIVTTSGLASTAGAGANAATIVLSPTQPVVVDVLQRHAEGSFRVQIEGQETLAHSALPLLAGARYVLQVERTPQGLMLRPPAIPSSGLLPVATAVLRTPAQPVVETVPALQAEITQLLTSPSTSVVEPLPLRQAAAGVTQTLQGLLPNPPRPLQANEIQRWVEHGGLLYEAKLAQVIDKLEVTSNNPTEKPPEAFSGKSAAATASETERGEPAGVRLVHAAEADLKADLLRLLQTVPQLGAAVRPSLLSATQAVLTGIEAQQAFNVLAQSSHSPYVFQVPLAENGVWRTLRLALEPEYRPGGADNAPHGRFRLFMHVPLQELGETWIDAGLAGDQFRATIYLDRPAVRQRVEAALPELQAELAAEGFAEVLLAVRAASELSERQRKQAAAMQAGRPETVSRLDVRV